MADVEPAVMDVPAAEMPAAVVNAPVADKPAVVTKSGEDTGVGTNEAPPKTNLPAWSPVVPSTEAAIRLVESPKVDPRCEGRLRLEYDHRSQGDSKDEDFYGYWSAAGRELSNGHIDVYTSGRLHADPGSSDAGDSDSTFTSLDDLRGVTEERVLQLYAEAHDQEHRIRLRGGRQYVDIADYIRIDGGQLMLLEEDRLGGRIYVGRPVSYYVSTAEELAFGVSVVGRPWEGNRTRLTYARFDASAGDSDQDYCADTRQELSDTKWMRAQASLLNGEFRMASLDVYCFSPDGDTSFYFGGSRWGEYDAQTRFYSPLYSVLGGQDPYTYGYARLVQALLPCLTISPGVSFRVTNGDDPDARNRDYNDYDVTLSFEPSRAFSCAISLDYWDTQGGDSFYGVSGEVRCRSGRKWDVSAGTAYVDYTYTSYSDVAYSINGGQTTFTVDGEGVVITETPYSYTYFLRTRWKLSRNLTLRLQGDIEDHSENSDLAYRGRGSIEVRL